MIEAPTVPNNESYVIVRITNKTDFDFTPAMGAMYAGVPMPIQAGKSLLAPKPAALHLAKHLARQTFIKKSPIRDEKETDGKGVDRALWTEEDIDRVKMQFISNEYAEERVAPKTEAEVIAAKVAELNKEFPTGTPTDVKTDVAQATYSDKAEVIAELERRNIKHDKRQAKDKLEALLK